MTEPLNALQVLGALARGEMTPDQAAVWARATGEPLPYGRPSPARFDPLSENLWTPLQAVMWIASRDIERVRDVSEGFRRWWTELEEVEGEFIVAGTFETVRRRVWVRKTVAPATYAQSVATLRGVETAKRELWRALESGKLSATGFRGEPDEGLTLAAAHLRPIAPARERAPIPPRCWNDLRFPGEPASPAEWRGPPAAEIARACVRADDRYCDAPDRLRSDHGVVYTGVRVARDDLLRLWLPAAQEAMTPRRRPGRPGDETKRVAQLMRVDLANGYDLAGAKEIELLEKYRAKSRNPVRTARKLVLNETQKAN